MIGASGVELLAECLQIQEEETQTLAMAALLGLSTELEAKERISDACVEDLMRLQYSPSPQLVSWNSLASCFDGRSPQTS